MDAGKDIINVCLPMTAGAFLSYHLGLNPPLVHIAAAASAAVLCALLLLSGTSAARSRVFWTAVFFCLGVFCSCASSVCGIGSCGLSPFACCRDTLGAVIMDSPLKQERSKALAKALLLGDRSSLDKDCINAFRGAGGAHLLALSGMHLGIIYAILSRLGALLGYSIAARRIRSSLIILLTGAYTLLTGAAPSLCRAFLFIFLRELSLMLDRPQKAGHIFCSALTLHIVLNPSAVGDIGFQLSYLAMVGIVFAWPHVRGWYDIPGVLAHILAEERVQKSDTAQRQSSSTGRKIWDAASLGICCQLFTAPLTLLYFGTFPKYFLITNLVAAPLTSVVMVCALIILGSGLFGWQSELLMRACEMPIRLLCSLMETITSM